VPYETKGKYQRVSKQKSDKDVISSESDSRLTAYHPHTYPHTHTRLLPLSLQSLARSVGCWKHHCALQSTSDDGSSSPTYRYIVTFTTYDSTRPDYSLSTLYLPQSNSTSSYIVFSR